MTKHPALPALTGGPEANRRKKLSTNLKAICGIIRVMGSQKGPDIENYSVDDLEAIIGRIEVGFPGLVPPFNKRKYLDFVSEDQHNTHWYNLAAIRGYLEQVKGVLEAELEEETGMDAPLMEHEDFLFVNDKDLRDILARDYQEIQRGYIAQNWKSVIILAGGAIEGILLDALKQDEAQAKAAKAAKNGPLEKWDLSDLISVSAELGLVSAKVEGISNAIREYRNLVHPGVELRTATKHGQPEATIAIEILKILKRDLG